MQCIKSLADKSTESQQYTQKRFALSARQRTQATSFKVLQAKNNGADTEESICSDTKQKLREEGQYSEACFYLLLFIPLLQKQKRNKGMT